VSITTDPIPITDSMVNEIFDSLCHLPFAPGDPAITNVVFRGGQQHPVYIEESPKLPWLLAAISRVSFDILNPVILLTITAACG